MAEGSINKANVLIGTIEPYVVGTPFTNYSERLEYLFQVNGIDDPAKQKALFVTLSGPAVYEELKLLYPSKDDLKNVSYGDISQKLRERFDKVDSDLIQRYKFYNRVQGPNEKAEDFVLAVKLQAEFCAFGEFRETAIRDKLVMGVSDKALQEKLLNEENPSLATVERFIVNWELAGSRARMIGDRQSSQVASVRQRLGRRETYEKKIIRNKSRSRSRSAVYKQGRNKNDEFKRHGRYADKICDFCGIKGHIKRTCYKRMRQERHSVKFIDERNDLSFGDEQIGELFNRLGTDLNKSESDSGSGDFLCMKVSSINRISEPCFLKIKVQDQLVKMEVDCGSAVSVIGSNLYDKLFDLPLQRTDKELMVVNGSKLNILGKVDVMVRFRTIDILLPLFVLNCDYDFVPLMGRKWLDVFYPDWKEYFTGVNQINTLRLPNSAESILLEMKQKYSQVFSKDLSSPIIGFEADLVLKDDTPIFKRAYEVPFRLREKVVEHLSKLEKENIITPIKTSEWASPVVVVPKKNGEIRLVIDCKVSINKLIIPNSYPLPLAQDIFADLAGCKIFCALDLEGAYTQLLLSDKSRKFVVINTIKGLYTYNRLPQGASSSAAIFQQVMEQVLSGLKHIRCYLDDVLIAGRDLEDCSRKVFAVLDRLAKVNIKVNWSKCKFFVSSLPYLGHVISENGLLPCPDKLATIREAAVPKNVTELKSFLGLVNYYGKFIPHLSSKISYLYRLLKKDVKYVWDENSDKAFVRCKNELLNANILEFYDPMKPIVVVSDASGIGLGGVIAHEIDGVEKPISFTSFSLNKAQMKYPILHLEALALVCTVKKFHKFLYGQKFVIYTDHKPLVGIFGKTEKNAIFVTRLQRYVLEMAIYDFDIIYRPSEKMGNADFCSRFPLKQIVPEQLDKDTIKSINFSQEFPVDFSQVANETRLDEFLQQVVHFIQNGWPARIDKRYAHIFSNRIDLEFVGNCLLFQDRVLIPKSMHSGILKLLHANHSGVVKMKQLARRSVFWFGINSDIEKYVGVCESCRRMAVVPKPKVVSAWIPTKRPFSRIHADFFHFEHKVFLLIVDSYSKWIEIEWMKHGTDSRKVLKKFVGVFARFGLPDVVVTDGGPPFNSCDFITFLERQGVKVLKSPPYNPPSNGQAERSVRIVKDVLKRFMLDYSVKKLEIEDQINLFLINYRNTCLSLDGKFPSENIFSFKPKMLIDLVNPKNHYKQYLAEPKLPNNRPNITEQFQPIEPIDKCNMGDWIFYKNHNSQDFSRWIKAQFIKKLSNNLFQIVIGNVRLTAHRNQLKVPHNKTAKARGILIPYASRGRRDGGTECKSASRKRNFRGTTSDDEEIFRGFPEEIIKRRRLSSEIQTPTLRKSNRLRRAKIEKNFIYSKS
ncbi:uncharacterized protein K02A2.6-like [Malaya genurostris]|uniref:uncharacterized protein K02A2.6-like n=1 Tax=Malaya genurostris TaxID=325434 RepID=UPI0026F3B7E4|nr:uncharacterized protein K02A2.6-like [Malaya genurostris]XP_058457115.1 uncharacterized protein K02A2.6-like [Malaya genurostris]